MIIGVDFDNTIVNYDDIIYRLAVQQGLNPLDSNQGKKQVRDTIRQLPNGDVQWQKLQALIYGKMMDQAKLMKGVKEFFRLCQLLGVKIHIVSHKTEYADLDGEKINLRSAALQWMENNDFFNANGLDLRCEDVFFEPTRAEKIERIKKLNCTHFVDDLEETFLEPSFPKGVNKILYSPQRQSCLAEGTDVLACWDEIISFMHNNIMDNSSLINTLSKLMDRNVSFVEPINNGKNSKVYKVVCDDQSAFCAKFYFFNSLDKRDRLTVEFSGLQFLWENGVRCIPKPIIADKSLSCGIFEYVEGEKLTPAKINDRDIDSAVDFLSKLNGLKSVKGVASLINASEACFSISEIVDNIQSRLDKLSKSKEKSSTNDKLHDYLKNEYLPLFKTVVSWAKKMAAQLDGDYDTQICSRERTLSPSDFGFHNAIKKPDGRIVFIDFEYFGWDDPAKMISDFLLHPAIEYGQDMKQRFMDKMMIAFGADSALSKRTEIVYPLFGLKWCLILLNEYLPEHMLRRNFAKKEGIDRTAVLMQQLAKSGEMLSRISGEYQNFPYKKENNHGKSA